MVTMAQSSFEGIVEFDQDQTSTFNIIRVTVSEPIFAKELAEVVLEELEASNRYYKGQTVIEKINFIEKSL